MTLSMSPIHPSIFPLSFPPSLLIPLPTIPHSNQAPSPSPFPKPLPSHFPNYSQFNSTRLLPLPPLPLLSSSLPPSLFEPSRLYVPSIPPHAAKRLFRSVSIRSYLISHIALRAQTHHLTLPPLPCALLSHHVVVRRLSLECEKQEVRKELS